MTESSDYESVLVFIGVGVGKNTHPPSLSSFLYPWVQFELSSAP